jgi:hypothetical protein
MEECEMGDEKEKKADDKGAKGIKSVWGNLPDILKALAVFIGALVPLLAFLHEIEAWPFSPTPTPTEESAVIETLTPDISTPTSTPTMEEIVENRILQYYDNIRSDGNSDPDLFLAYSVLHEDLQKHPSFSYSTWEDWIIGRRQNFKVIISLDIDGGQAITKISLEVIEEGEQSESAVNTLCLVYDLGEWYIHDFYYSDKSGTICSSINN